MSRDVAKMMLLEQEIAFEKRFRLDCRTERDRWQEAMNQCDARIAKAEASLRQLDEPERKTA